MKILTPIALLIAAVGLIYVFVRPHYDIINTIRAESRVYDETIDQVQRAATKQTDILNRRESLKADDVKRLQKLLPDNVDGIKLAVDINSVAARYGSSIKGIKVSAPNIQQTADTIGPDTRPYGTITMEFSVSMTYDQFQKFITDIEQSLRISEISSVSFKPSDLSSTYDFSVTLQTYWLK